MFESFISSFCKVEFLCYQGDPNWLGLILLGIGALVVIGIAIVIIMAGIIGLWLAEGFVGAMIALIKKKNKV